jgi:hypothetical protein
MNHLSLNDIKKERKAYLKNNKKNNSKEKCYYKVQCKIIHEDTSGILDSKILVVSWTARY